LTEEMRFAFRFCETRQWSLYHTGFISHFHGTPLRNTFFHSSTSPREMRMNENLPHGGFYSDAHFF